MQIGSAESLAPYVRLWINDDDGKVVARVRLYLHHNDLHKEPYGYVEDLFVDPATRGQGLAKKLMQELIERARKAGCYKIVAGTRKTRPLVHKLYTDLGFIDHGKEFRMDLP